jgi:hypothetical protein
MLGGSMFPYTTKKAITTEANTFTSHPPLLI